jgi:hypothetical protein
MCVFPPQSDGLGRRIPDADEQMCLWTGTDEITVLRHAFAGSPPKSAQPPPSM